MDRRSFLRGIVGVVSSMAVPSGGLGGVLLKGITAGVGGLSGFGDYVDAYKASGVSSDDIYYFHEIKLDWGSQFDKSNFNPKITNDVWLGWLATMLDPSKKRSGRGGGDTGSGLDNWVYLSSYDYFDEADAEVGGKLSSLFKAAAAVFGEHKIFMRILESCYKEDWTPHIRGMKKLIDIPLSDAEIGQLEGRPLVAVDIAERDGAITPEEAKQVRRELYRSDATLPWSLPEEWKKFIMKKFTKVESFDVRLGRVIGMVDQAERLKA